MELVILIGLPASGKSTFAQRYFAASHDYLSKDRLRNNRRPGRRQGHLIVDALGASRSVVVDNTNPSIEARSARICLGQAYGARIVGYYFPALPSEALVRNRSRAGNARVPNVPIHVARNKLVPPAYAEGFDALYAVRIEAGGASQAGGPGRGRRRTLSAWFRQGSAAGWAHSAVPERRQAAFGLRAGRSSRCRLLEDAVDLRRERLRHVARRFGAVGQGGGRLRPGDVDLLPDREVGQGAGVGDQDREVLVSSCLELRASAMLLKLTLTISPPLPAGSGAISQLNWAAS
jgi:predicted kinase